MRRSLTAVLLATVLASGPASANEAPKAGEGKESAAGTDAKARTKGYAHQWAAFPAWQARHVISGETVSFAPKRGEAGVVVFLSSWCVPCQDLMPRFKAMADRFRGRGARFAFVFAYDTLSDARDFATHHKLADDAVLANVDVMKAFNQPELPTLFVADTRGWLARIDKKPDGKGLDDLEAFLAKITAL